MNIKKIIALAVALLMLASCFIGCKKVEDDAVSTTVATQEGEIDYLAQIPIIDYGGEEFTIVSPTRSWAETRMTASEMNADIINDALYERTVSMKERLNIQLTDVMVGSARTHATNSILAGNAEYELLVMWPSDALAMSLENLVVDQNAVSSINMDNPWWEKNLIEQINVGSKSYITYNKSNLILYSGYYLFVFNKELVQDNKLDDPYELVADQTWTWETAYEMMKTVSEDTDGDGVSTPGAGETLGFVGHINHSQNLILSAGHKLTYFNADGNPVWPGGLTQNYVDAFTTYTEYFIENPYTAISGRSPSPFAEYSGTSGLANYLSYFNEGKSLFLTTGSSEVQTIRNSNVEYGIVVFPKYDLDQKDYVTPIYKACDGFAIPSDHSEESLVNIGIVMETLGAYSIHDSIDLVDKHIETVLHHRIAGEETAMAMISMAYEKADIDVCLSNNFGKCADTILALNTEGATDITSRFGNIKNQIEADIEKSIAQ